MAVLKDRVLGPEDIKVPDFEFDVDKLESVIWDAYDLAEGCPICELDKKNPRELSRIHNDELNYGYTSSAFKKRWKDKFPFQAIRSHFTFHCIPGDLVKWAHKQKKMYDQDRALLQENQKFLSEQDQENIRRTLRGDFSGVMSTVASTAIRQLRFAEERQNQAEMSGDVNSEETWHHNSVETVRHMGKLFLDMDKNFHNKTNQAVRTYLEYMKVEIMQEMVNRTGRRLDELEQKLAGRIGVDAAKNLIDMERDVLKDEIAQLYEEFEAKTPSAIPKQ